MFIELIALCQLSLHIRFFFLQEVDPCEDLTDEDIRTAIQNATGPKSALFVPEVGLNLIFACILYYTFLENMLSLSLCVLAFYSTSGH